MICWNHIGQDLRDIRFMVHKMDEKGKPRVIVLSGYGLNCEEETLFAFEKAGAKGDIVHINDLIAGLKKMDDYQILAFPGGFSYGDDIGSGMAYANKMRNNMKDQYMEFMNKDKLAIGICNGFQIMVNLGLLPTDHGETDQVVALTHNNSARYMDRWVDLKFNPNSPWTKRIDTLSLPKTGRSVAKLLVKGFNQVEIAKSLNITKQAVNKCIKTHLKVLK